MPSVVTAMTKWVLAVPSIITTVFEVCGGLDIIVRNLPCYSHTCDAFNTVILVSDIAGTEGCDVTAVTDLPRVLSKTTALYGLWACNVP